MKKKGLFFILLIFSLILNPLFAEVFRWPVDGIKDSFITAYFGESRDDHFHNGIDISNQDGKIFPVDNGEIIFYWDYTNSLYPEEFGTGKTIVVQHAKNRSYYSHLKEVIINKKYLVDKKTQIGVMGNSGRSTGPHLHLGIKKDGLSINPIDQLPKIKDTFDPIIKNIVIRSGYFQKMIQPNSQSNNKIYLPLRDQFLILIDAYDPIDSKSFHRNIKKVSVHIGGVEGTVFENTLEFNFIKNSKLNGILSLHHIYTKIWNEKFFVMGKWEKKNRKNNYQMTVTAENNMGNTSVVRKTIIFK